MLNDPNDNEARAAAFAALQKLAVDPANGVLKIVDGAEARTMGGFPDAAFVVFVKPGWTVGGSFEGAAVRSTPMGGAHGLWRGLPEMDATFSSSAQASRAARLPTGLTCATSPPRWLACSAFHCPRRKAGTCFLVPKSDFFGPVLTV